MIEAAWIPFRLRSLHGPLCPDPHSYFQSICPIRIAVHAPGDPAGFRPVLLTAGYHEPVSVVCLSDLLHLGGYDQGLLSPLCGRLLAVCGSINPVSLEQCAQAEAQGAPRFSLTPEQKLSRDWAAGAQAGEMLGAVLRACSQEPVVVLDTGGAVENAGADKTADRIQIANTLGALLKRLLDDGLESTVLIMGGDCLLGLMRQLDVTEIMPLCEVAPGVVLSQFTYGGRQWNLVSKSGGFGAKTLFCDLQNILERWKKELPAV